MKNYKLLSFLILGLLVSQKVHPQTNPRLVNENYMQTVFFDDFLGTALNRNIWDVTTYKRGLGVLADDPRTIRVFQGNLELTMIYSKDYSSGGYSGSSFEAGMYLYTLVINGREVDTKRMILTK